MKKILSAAIILLLMGASITTSAQDKSKIPAIDVQNLDGSKFNTGNLTNGGKPMIINFWATWCSPCKRELNNIADMYEDWVEETGVKLVAISIDDTRKMAKVAPYVNGKGWEYDIYIDPNGDFKKSTWSKQCSSYFFSRWRRKNCLATQFL